MATHRLKLNSDYYNDSASGIKTFEIRKNDRNYQVGDILELRCALTYDELCSIRNTGRKSAEEVANCVHSRTYRLKGEE